VGGLEEEDSWARASELRSDSMARVLASSFASAERTPGDGGTSGGLLGRGAAPSNHDMLDCSLPSERVEASEATVMPSTLRPMPACRNSQKSVSCKDTYYIQALCSRLWRFFTG
jgi:hypothetical protein